MPYDPEKGPNDPTRRPETRPGLQKLGGSALDKVRRDNAAKNIGSTALNNKNKK